MNSDQLYPLLWKGRQTGPFPLAAIREQLHASEISRMHQIQVQGRWVLLDEFLEKESAAARPRSQGGRQSSALAHLLPAPAPVSEVAQELEWRPLPPPAPRRTSRLAVASLLFALSNFIPWVDAVTWLGALVCGHLALAQMEEDPTLGGRSLALTALAITYFLLVVVVTFAILMLANGRPLF